MSNGMMFERSDKWYYGGAHRISVGAMLNAMDQNMRFGVKIECIN